MPRRILLLITDLEIGGTPTVVRELAIRLNQTNAVEVEVACLADEGPVVHQLRNASVFVTALMARGPRSIGVLPKLIRLIRDRKYDTVVSFLIHASAVAAGASLFVRDVRWIQSIQTTQPHPSWHWILQRIVHHAAATIVVPSASAASAAERWSNIPQSKIKVIANAIELSDFDQSHIPNRPPNPYPISFIGRLDPIKNVPSLIHALTKLKSSVHLNIYGEGSDRGRIEQTIEQLHVKDIVTLRGSIDSPRMASASSGLIILPSLAEGFGLVLIEAMAAGVPIVATTVAGIVDVVRSGETGLLVPPSNPAAMAEAIDQIIMDVDLRNRLIQNAAREVRARFTWQTVLAQYRSLLRV